EHDADREAEADPLEARDDVPAEVGEEPLLLEVDEDRRETRELRRVSVRRPELPGGEDRDGDCDLRRDCEPAVRPAAHAEPSRCEGCQHSRRRSSALSVRWIASPRKPTAIASA